MKQQMMVKLLVAFTLAVYVQADTLCPDKKQLCDSNHTCCHLPLAVAGSEWGCCPFENGVCCADGSTCCRADQVCVPGKRACVSYEAIVKDMKLGSELKPSMAVSEPREARNKFARFGGNVDRFEKHLSWVTDEKADADLAAATSKTELNRTKELLCPDQQSLCAEGSTCCLLGTGFYGCCSLVDAVCCNDQEHCCPQNMKCDVSQSRCIKNDGSYTTFIEKLVAYKTEMSKRNKPTHAKEV